MLGLKSTGGWIALAVVAAIACCGCSGSRPGEPGGASPASDDGAAIANVHDPQAQAGETLFRTRCANCHTVGRGVIVGPDLKNVQRRRDEEWIVRWLRDPEGMGRRDVLGRQLVGQYNGLVMTDPKLDDLEIRQLLAYIAAASAGPSRQAGL